LKRGADGKLGVQSSGSIGNIIVNVDATGTNTQADTTDSKRLGGLIGAAVQQELIKQKRPGGLLA
jgi:phage-related minor tail protein